MTALSIIHTHVHKALSNWMQQCTHAYIHTCSFVKMKWPMSKSLSTLTQHYYLYVCIKHKYILKNIRIYMHTYVCMRSAIMCVLPNMVHKFNYRLSVAPTRWFIGISSASRTIAIKILTIFDIVKSPSWGSIRALKRQGKQGRFASWEWRTNETLSSSNLKKYPHTH